MPTPEFTSEFSREGKTTPARTTNGAAPTDSAVDLAPIVAAAAEETTTSPVSAATVENPGSVRTVCVYCSSSNALGEKYKQLARETAAEIVRHGLKLVYGGGDVGLMGILAREVKRNGGHVTGIIPTFIKDKEVGFLEGDELIEVETMRERKAAMEFHSDGFIVLPGGFGTMEEMLEILALKQLHRHDKNMVLLNAFGFYDHLLALFEHFYKERIAGEKCRALFTVAGTPAEAVNQLIHTPRFERADKWYETAG
ncbi:MAG: TIGR00730 family Rossman fold protein [Candidatus Methylacidiphilales bacterium]|nr:TIGR00730 family Rossman fold protein [Candidatus Methylacidiphilales bacterium]